MQGCWHLELLGEIRLTAESKVVDRFSTQKVAALLVYLATRMPASVPRESLIEMFWPDQELDAGRNSLSVALSSLRRQLALPNFAAEHILKADRFHAALNPEAVTTDVAEFERLLKAGEDDPAGEHLARAVALYKGDFAQGIYYDWAIREQVRLQGLYMDAALQLISHLEKEGQYAEALPTAYRAVEVDCFSEPANRALIRLLAANKRPALALEAAERLERLYKDEFGAEPSKPTRQLVAWLRQDPLGAVAALSSAAPSSKAAPESESIASGDAPARRDAKPATPPAEPVPVSNLPLRLTRLFGRTQEIEQIAAMLCPDPAKTLEPHQLLGEPYRLVTLTGPGGTGKTRLSQEVGSALTGRFPGQICFVALAELRDSAEIPSAILNALAIRTSPESEPVAEIVAHLKNRPTLLILDNLEQLLGDEPVSATMESHVEAGQIVYRLLEQAPSLVCLCTSRRRLGIEGEREYRVSPLPLPDKGVLIEQMIRTPSVQLYVDRAQAARVDFQLTPGNAASIGELCRRLEGIPLAIELAAAWVRTLPPTPMLERLKNRLALPEARYADVPARHRSLTAVFDWSFALLTPRQQRFLSRLALFSGGWTLESAAAVCDEPEALELTESLLSASLAYDEHSDNGARYRLLETVREYSLQRLQASGELAETTARYRQYFVELSQQANERIEGAEQKEWLEHIHEEYGNLCAVMDSDSADPDGGEASLQIAPGIWRYWFIRGHLREGVARLTSALLHPNASHWPFLRMLAYIRRGSLLTHLNRYIEADSDFALAFTLAEQVGDTERQCASLNNRAMLKCDLGEHEEAKRLGLQALEMSRQHGHRRLEGNTLGSLGVIALAVRDLPAARQRLECCITRFRELDNRHLVAVNLLNLANVAIAEGDPESAKTYGTECLELCRTLRADRLLSDALLFAAQQRCAVNEYREAARLCGAVSGLLERLDIYQKPASAAALADASSQAREALENEVFAVEFAAGRGLSPAEVVASALKHGPTHGRAYVTESVPPCSESARKENPLVV